MPLETGLERCLSDERDYIWKSKRLMTALPLLATFWSFSDWVICSILAVHGEHGRRRYNVYSDDHLITPFQSKAFLSIQPLFFPLTIPHYSYFRFTLPFLEIHFQVSSLH